MKYLIIVILSLITTSCIPDYDHLNPDILKVNPSMSWETGHCHRTNRKSAISVQAEWHFKDKSEK